MIEIQYIQKDMTIQAIQEYAQRLDWEFREHETQYLTHNIHRYSGKFIPQIARQAIEIITEPGQLVLDPYMGSGTTLLECMLTGRNSIGIDLNPLAVLIARVKTQPVNTLISSSLYNEFEELLGCLGSVLEGQKSLFINHFIHEIEEAKEDFRLNDPWYTKWFQSHVLFELVVIFRHILALEDEILKNISLVSFSNILRRFSNAHSGYPNVMFDKNSPQKTLPGRHFLKSLRTCIDMVNTLNENLLDYRPRIIEGNATNIPLEDESIDAIVTHPPYIGSVPYAEYGLLSLTWLGHDAKWLDQSLTGGKRQSRDVIERFKTGYSDMLSESYRVLKPGAKIFLMVGNPVVKGELVNLEEMSIDLAELAGFKKEALVIRNGVNRRANKMGDESLLFFSKC